MNHTGATGRRPGPLRWGVLGATAYISGLLMPAIARTPGCALAAVASRPGGADVAAATARRYGAAAHRDYASLVADGDVDVVYIALPNTDHVEWTLRALAAGKHVLVEKPMAMTEKDCVRIEQAAREAGRLAMEAFMYRFHTQQRRAAELLAAGTIGDLRVVRASFAFAIADGSGNIRLERSLGGGATWDVGCYAMDVPSLFFGRAPERVQGRFTSRPGADVETSAVGLMDFGDGRGAVIDYSIDYGPRAWYELQGTHGTIGVRNAWAMGAEDGVVTVTTGGGVTEERVAAADHYQLQVAGFARAVAAGGPVPVPPAHSRWTARVGESLAASAALDGAAVSTADPEQGTARSAVAPATTAEAP
ncbi:Gfo/Idh/MocA family oxidoreductase [Microbispora sp. RL4-1S]|uniref:Gfo/Idh/MocA family oxidoreductase n=1 Tax=Microbispora oryzae TaxID=2806554 RepID=A0A940WV63_9ACTN|nr:Gfo/Idh/MocA family oxidoreductase [Microbispora oryzae]MBP2707985.1 Gfo/Idh/MocA family oxidoreductase [Microbispora oryzae]